MIPEAASAAGKVARMAHMRHVAEQLNKLEERLRLRACPTTADRMELGLEGGL